MERGTIWHDRVDHAVSSLRAYPMSGDPSSVLGRNAISLWAENVCVASTIRRIGRICGKQAVNPESGHEPFYSTDNTKSFETVLHKGHVVWYISYYIFISFARGAWESQAERVAYFIATDRLNLNWIMPAQGRTATSC